jgi:ParB family transcriptional regulator, chromosome partitioning protein
MSKPSGGLGRGLGSLIPQKIAPAAGTEAAKVADASIVEISPDQIVVNPHQPRTHFSSSDLEDLIASIKEHGIIQPLVVTRKEEGEYELIAGERRLRSSRMLGLAKVPVVVRSATEQQKLELALIENIQRQQLNAVEEAKAYQALADQFSLKQDEVGKRVGKSRSYVANTMRLLELEEDMLQALSVGKISRSHARTLLAEKDEDQRRRLFEKMLTGDMTVREAEARAGHKARSIKKGKDPNVAALEAQLRESLGTKVQIQMNGNTGKVSIHFYSKEELKELMDRLSS